MLKILTYIDKSTIPNAGLGVFNINKIYKGNVVWENNPISEIRYTQDEWKLLPNEFKSSISIYVYKNNNTYILNLDNSRHMNHSDYPNLDVDSVGNNIANIDIDENSELTCNYNLFYDKDWLEKTLSK